MNNTSHWSHEEDKSKTDIVYDNLELKIQFIRFEPFLSNYLNQKEHQEC